MGFAFELRFVECFVNLSVRKRSDTSHKQNISSFPFMFLDSPSALLSQFYSAKMSIFPHFTAASYK